MKMPKINLFFTGSLFIAQLAFAQAQTGGMSNTAPAGSNPQNPSGIVTNPPGGSTVNGAYNNGAPGSNTLNGSNGTNPPGSTTVNGANTDTSRNSATSDTSNSRGGTMGTTANPTNSGVTGVGGTSVTGRHDTAATRTMGSLENSDDTVRTTDTSSTGARTDTAMNPDGSVATADQTNNNDRVGMSALGFTLILAAIIAIAFVAVRSYRQRHPHHV